MHKTVCRVLRSLVAIGLGMVTCNAQDPADAVTSPAETAIEIAFDDVMEEFRQLVCDAAIDMDSPVHRQSLSIIARRGYTDSRFDEFIRSTLRLHPVNEDDFGARFDAVEVLLPRSTLPEDERVRLLLDLLGQENEAFETGLQKAQGSINAINAMGWPGSVVSVSRIATMLSRSQPALHAALKERISTQQPKAILVAATQLIKLDAADLLPDLIRAAKSDHVPLQMVAMETIDQLSIQVSVRSMRGLSSKEAGVGDKTIKYAEKIVARYDTDGDNAITATEWKTMLVDPSAADLNSDGFVTVMEYAAWMQKRSSR